MKKSNWTTQRGAAIELTTEHITKKEVNADGWKVEVEDDRIEIVNVKINGKDYRGTLTFRENQNAIDCGSIKVGNQNQRLTVLIPADIYEIHWEEYDARQKAKYEAKAKADAEYEAHYNKIMRAMNR